MNLKYFTKKARIIQLSFIFVYFNTTQIIDVSFKYPADIDSFEFVQQHILDDKNIRFMFHIRYVKTTFE